MKTWNLKKEFNEYNCKTFKFEINFSKSGVARIYLGGRKTVYYAGGYGYDKTSSVIALMINDLIGEQNYNKDVYGNSDGLLSGGTGFSSIKDSFESITGNKLTQIYNGLNSIVYEVVFA
jgi:hypothetical protein